MKVQQKKLKLTDELHGATKILVNKLDQNNESPKDNNNNIKYKKIGIVSNLFSV